jgi:hypothetical protein
VGGLFWIIGAGVGSGARTAWRLQDGAPPPGQEGH